MNGAARIWIIDGKEDKFDLDEDDDEEVITINFKLDEDAINEMDASSSAYVFYIWATGEYADNNNKTSTYESKNIDLQIENNFVILDNIEISESASCGSEVQVTADVWNIGEDKQDDVYVIIYNKALGINQKVTIGDIKYFENENLEATVLLPEDADEESYILEFYVYNDNSDIYESNNEDEDESRYSKEIIVEGSCSTTPKVSVIANLESESAVAGKEIVIKATVTNLGTKTSTYLLNAGNTEWASLVSIDKNSFTLDAGKSEEVLITLNVNKDASGEKEFSIDLVEGNNVLTQPVKVVIEQPSLFPNITGLISGVAGDNWYLWGIGALNVLLVLIIIIVALKVSKKQE